MLIALMVECDARPRVHDLFAVLRRNAFVWPGRQRNSILGSA